MTFPTPRTPEFSLATFNPRVVDLPSGIQAGDLMVVVIAGSSALTPPSGWTLISGGWGTGSDGDGIYWKIAVGGETSASWTSSSSTRHVGMAFKDASAAEYAFLDQAGSSAPNCPSVTPSWGSADNVFVALNYWSDTSDTPTGYPASYTLMQAAEAGTTGFRVSARQLAAATDNPAAQTASGAMTLLRSVTLAIQPTVASAAQSVSRGSYMMG